MISFKPNMKYKQEKPTIDVRRKTMEKNEFMTCSYSCSRTPFPPNALCLLQENWRNVVVILIWVEAGLFLAMAISGIMRFCCKWVGLIGAGGGGGAANLGGGFFAA
jgi:hypothetical protein